MSRVEAINPTTTMTIGPNVVADDPEIEKLDRDEFLGQVEGTVSIQGFSERIDPFSGTLHLNQVDLTLPGNAGLDIVIQHYYSSNVWNRVDDVQLARHVASADLSDRLGGGGWQLHMGKLMNPNPGVNSFTTLIMSDGATHTLFNRADHPDEKITPEGWIHTVSDSVHTIQTTTGLKYIFDSTAFGAQYTYLGMDGLIPIQIIQCTRIEDLNGNAIVIEYSKSPGGSDYETRIDRISFDDPTDTREVVFNYHGDTGILDTMQLKNDSVVVETWRFAYYSPAIYVLQPQFLFIEARWVYQLQGVEHSLTGDWLNEGLTNPWIYTYYDDDEENTPLTSGQLLIESVITPRVGKITYTWGPEVMDTGALSCTNTPQFLTVQTRQSAVGIGQAGGEIIYEDEATSVYTYTLGGREGATTNVVTTDSQTSIELTTEEHVFHGWEMHTYNDPNMWKVGLPTSSTFVIKDDSGGDLEATTIATTWEQGDPFSPDIRWSSAWVSCGGPRFSGPQTYVKPEAQTRVVERYDSIPDPPPPTPVPDSYTTVSSEFDNWGNVGLVTETSSDSLNRSTSFTYWQDLTNNIMVGHIQGRDADPGGTQCFQYDSLGRVSTSFVNPQTDDVATCTPSDSILGARQTDYAYYADGNLQIQTEHSIPNNRVTTHTDYQFGSPRETTIATGTGLDIQFCRDFKPRGMTAWETDGRGCSADFRTVYTYDFLGRRTSTVPPLSDPVLFEYPNFDLSVARVIRGTQQREYRFDRIGSGNLTDIINLQSLHWVELTNDALGRRRQAYLRYDIQPGDTHTYDPLGRLTAITHPDTPTTQATIEYSGSEVTVEDENGHTTQYLYEAFGDPADRRLASLVDAAGYTTSYGYDPVFGQLSTVTAPIAQGNRSFEYFSGSSDCDNGLLEREIHPESGETTYQYNCLGAVTRRDRPGSEITIYGYDRAGRLTEISYPDDAGVVTMGYDGASRQTSLINPSASSTSTYDDAGRLETVTQSIIGGPQDQITIYGYDALDRLKTITYPSTRVVTYWWDDRNWLESLTGEDGSGVEYLPSITYLNTGAPDIVTFANGVMTDYAIDDRNRLTGIVTSGLMNIGIEYDDASNVEIWTDYLSPSKSRSFGYDSLDRLTSAVSPGLWGELGFTYDELGNRRTRTLNDETTDYNYDEPTNRLAALSGAEGGIFTYDELGRLATEERGSVGEIFSDGFESGDTGAWGTAAPEGVAAWATTLVYTFNAADQLTRVESDGETLVDSAYDGDGLRVSKTVDGQTVFYLRDPAGNTLAEYDQDSNPLAEYLYAGGRQVAKVEPDGVGGDDVSFFHADHLGSALVITDDTGTVTWSGDYYPFGEEYSSVGTPDRYRFTQHELDTDTALIYAKARYYNPRIGRFLSVDPVGGDVGSSQSWNRYSYVLNNPLKYTDPDGLQEVSEVVAPPASMRKSSFGDFLRGVFSRMPGANLQPNIMMIADDSRPQQITPEQVQQLAEIADAISVLTGPPAHEDGATGSPRKTRSLEDPGSLSGATYDDVVGTVPENWQASPTRTGAGIRYANPERRGEQLRIMQGNATDPNPVKQGPYVRISSRGVVSDPIPLAGNPTLDPTNGR